MAKRFLVLGVVALVTGLGLNIAGAAEQGIATGTVITQQNWQKYKDFMPIPLQHMFMSTSPVSGWPQGAKAVVGKTIHYPPPSSYLDATEKYSKQVKLVKVPNGSYSISGYVAGTPFPNLDPKDPLAGYKLVYDLYFQRVVPFQVADHYQVLDFDRYGHESDLTALIISYQWMHITDPGYPMNIPGAEAYLSGIAEQLEPEQIKYITALSLVWDNPDRFPEAYVFLPSIRRALRLSTNARCTPFQAQDFANDDETPVPLPPTWFAAQYLGEKPLLLYVFKPDAASRKAGKVRANWYFTKGTFVPRADVFGANWQLRDTYILKMQRLPQYQQGYCYADRIQYQDAEQHEDFDLANWDQNGKFWRTFVGFPMPTKDGDGWFFLGNGAWAHDNCDYQNDHCSNVLPALDGVTINEEVPKQYQNRSLYGTPAGLSQIMQ